MDEDDDAMIEGEVIATRENLRVLLRQDPDAQEPYDDGGSPMIRLAGGTAEQVMCTAYRRLPQSILDAARLWGPTERFQRFLRIFHGGTRFYHKSHGMVDYMTFDTAEWRTAMGLTDEHLEAHPEVRDQMISMSDWEAYWAGEVYGWVLQRRVVWQRADKPTETMVSWEDVGSCWGYYWLKNARECALEALAREVETSEPFYATATGVGGATLTISKGGGRDLPGHLDIVVNARMHTAGVVLPEADFADLVNLLQMPLERTPDEQLSAARGAVGSAQIVLDTAVRRKVGELIREVYPAAVTLVATGTYCEDGLLHLHTDRIVDAEGTVLADVRDIVEPNEVFDELTNQVDALLDELSERDADYQGRHEFDVSSEN